MLKDDMWKIFEATGQIDAYLYCKMNGEDESNTENLNSEKSTEEGLKG